MCPRPFLRALSSFGNGSSPAPPSPRIIAWKPTGECQKTLASTVEISGTALHSGLRTTARLAPAMAGEGRYLVVAPGVRIPAAIEYAVGSRLCTTLRKDSASVRTVEHLLSALEASGVDNCSVEVEGGDELPILDGSSKVWLELIQSAGVVAAEDRHTNVVDRMAPFLLRPVYLQRNDSFVAAFPSSRVQITYGINFSRVEKLRGCGLIQGGSLENAIVCSSDAGWLNPPLYFHDEPCRHKVLDLVGDMSLFAQNGSQGLPVAHLIAYKGGHSLHAELMHHLMLDGVDGSSNLTREKESSRNWGIQIERE